MHIQHINASELQWLIQFYARRFWQKVNVGEPDECWPTKYRTTKKGGHAAMGMMTVKGKHIKVMTHRLAWMFTNGVIPQGLLVLHRCGNPKCCNPAHLYLGTHSDNALDAVRHGTHASSKLTPEDLHKIRTLRDEGHSQQTIADIVGCSQVRVSQILRRT